MAEINKLIIPISDGQGGYTPTEIKFEGSGGGGGSSGWTDSVTCSTGDTTCTIIDSQITTSSAVDPYCQNASGKPTNITNVVVTTGQAVLTFYALEEATSIKLNVIDISTDTSSSWSSSVSAAVGATSVTITDSNITTSSIVRIYSSTTSGAPATCNTIIVTTGQVALTFEELTEATSFRARIFNPA